MPVIRTSILLLWLGWSFAFGADRAPLLLRTDPVVEAKKAYERGDHRSIVVPMCLDGTGESLPGWPLAYTPAHLEALESGIRPFTCSDLSSESEFLRAAKYAERYNQTMLNLAKAAH